MLFKTLCESMDLQHERLLHTDITWLSRGRAISHLS